MKIGIFIITLFTLFGCSSLPTNFKIVTDMNEIYFYSEIIDSDADSERIQSVYVDTFVKFEIVNLSEINVGFYHDMTFVVPNFKRFPVPKYKHDQTVIKYYDQNKEEIFGSFASGYIDSSFVDKKVLEPEILDTITYNIHKSQSIQFSQKIKLPYQKGTIFISIDREDFGKVRYTQFCLSLGKKRKGWLYGCDCTDLIQVRHK
jgi:hypothetical protein